MMGRVMRIFKSIPKMFQQPANYIRRKTTKRFRNHLSINRSKSVADFASEPVTTLHLPPIRGQNSGGGGFGQFGGNPPPIIRIRRARSLNKNPMNNISMSENNLANLSLRSHSQTSVEKSRSNLSLKSEHVPWSTSLLSVSNGGSVNSMKYKGSVKVQKPKGASVKRSNTMGVGGGKSDIPRIVAEVIGEATRGGSRMERQMVRIINGVDPSVQSQVLLNTRTSQPWEDLVKDLGMAVKLPRSKRVGNRLETLYGRQIQSYSQLRSELKVGHNTFYIYGDDNGDDDFLLSLVPNLQRHRLSLTPEPTGGRVRRSSSNVSTRTLQTNYPSQNNLKSALAKTISNSSSEISSQYLNVPQQRRRPRRRSHTPTGSARRKSNSPSPLNSPVILPSNRIYLPDRSVHFRT